MSRGAAPVDRCPLTVIGGFLGAGKTTLLNRLLAEATGRTAVLVNDFGAVNVDAGLVRDHDGRTLRLTNGCVCCSLADGFLDTLMRVLAEPFDHVVIEASGVGDPWAIAEIALVEPTLRLAGVIVLADAERLPALLADPRIGDTVARQIRAADIVVLNKIDLVDEAGRTLARAALTTLRPDIRVAETAEARLPSDVLGGVTPGRRASRFSAHEATSEAVSHEDGFRRIAYRSDAAFDPDRLVAALRRLPPTLLRLKGAVRLAGRPDRRLLQVVGARSELSGLPPDYPAGPAIELVGIATDDAAEAALHLLLEAALATPSSDERCRDRSAAPISVASAHDL